MKNITFNLLISLSFILINLQTKAQVLPQTQYVFNPYLYNPAQAGQEGNTEFYLSYKKQWWGLEGAPDLGTLTFEMPLLEQLNIGGQLQYQSEGALNIISFLATAAYHVPLDALEEHHLAFGMSFGVQNRSFNMAEVSDPTDPALTDLAANNTGLIGNAGLYYAFNGFSAGFVLPQLFSQDAFVNSSFAEIQAQPFDYMIAMAGYKYYNDFAEYAIEPQVLYHFDKYVGNQFEGMLTFYYRDIVYGGASYRQSYGMSAYVGGNINDMFSLNYVYGFSSTAAASLPFNNATHEIGLRVILNSSGTSGGKEAVDWRTL